MKPYALELTFSRGWNLLGLPFELDAESRQALTQLPIFVVEKDILVRCDGETLLPGGAVIWLYYTDGAVPGDTLLISGSCAAQGGVSVAGHACLAAPLMDSLLPDAATLAGWGAHAWDPQAGYFRPAASVAPGQALMLLRPPVGEIFEVPAE